MSQEQVPEGAPPVDALLGGFSGRKDCKACALEAEFGGPLESAQKAWHELQSTEHVCGKSKLTVGSVLERWALTGQPGAAAGVPSCPPGTTLGR